jgi:dTDP-4-dehydrorhamnose 3,5-epimerase
VLSDTADFVYKATDYYAPKSERSLLWNDAEIGIKWPFSGEAILSAKDVAGVPFKSAEVYEGFMNSEEIHA